MQWTSGYITDVDYTHGYYRELAPTFQRYVHLLSAYALPDTFLANNKTQDFHYLELGYGQGIALNIHAAAYPGSYWGTDFNPNHAAQADMLANAAQLDVHLLDSAFTELYENSQLPKFDVIALHGVWSWVSNTNQTVIVEIIRRHLKVGGRLYISYNTMPGWSAAAPLQHLISLHTQAASADSASRFGKVENALQFIQQIVDAGGLYFQANPAVVERLKDLQQQNRAYLAHEYCNQHWQPMAFSQLISALEPAKLSFLGSAAIFDHIDLLNLSEAAQKILANIEHPVLKQSVRDYLVNQQFRRDYFVKGSRKLSLLEHQAALKQQAFILNTLPEAITLKVQGALGEMSLQEQVYLPLISALAEEQYRPKTFAELVAHPQLKEINFAGLNQALAILVGKGNVSPVSQYANDTTAKNNCHRLNTVLCEKAHYNGDVSVLASPITGSGIGVSRFQQMFMTAHQRGHTTANGMAEYAWNILNQQGQRLIKDQKTLETDTENLAELVMQANSFIAAMPLFNALGINIAKVENHEQKSNAYRINAVSEMQ